MLAVLAGLWVVPTSAVELPITATAAIVVDAETGDVLYQRDADQALPPASTTKVLTAILAIESGHLEDDLDVSANAASTPPTKVGLREGERARLHDLLYAVLLKSANDAAEVVAEGLSGSQEEFADRMNAKARRIGATNSHFENPHGLTAEGHTSTARDLARIFRYGLNLPLFREILGTRAIDFPVEDEGIRMVTVRSHNRLLNGYTYPVIGKTGFTRVARRCFVGAATGANREVVIALLGARDLWGDARKLIEFGLEGRTTWDDDLPVIMANRDARDAQNSEDDEDAPSPYAYERLARAHHRRFVPARAVSIEEPVEEPRRQPRRATALAALAGTRSPVAFVRRWALTRVHGRVIRTLIAEPVPRTVQPEPVVMITRGRSSKSGQIMVVKAPVEVGRRGGKPALAWAPVTSERAALKGKKVLPIETVKAKGTPVRLPVGKMAALKRTDKLAAPLDLKRGKPAAAPSPAPRGAAPRPTPGKLKVSSQRPSVVAHR